MHLRHFALCAALLCAMPTFAADASAPRPVAGVTHTLAQLLGANRMSQAQLSAAERSAVTLLIRQNLRTLDPDNRLGPEGTKALSTQLDADIRPAVRQTFAHLQSAEMTASLEVALTDTLSQAQTDSLLAFLRAPVGKRYLSFNRELDDLVGSGLARLASTPFAFRRDQMPPAATMQQRQRLLTLSTAANTLAAERSKGMPAAFGVISDLLAVQDGAALDRIGQRYRSDLPAFISFQASDAARTLARAEARWAAGESARLEPLIQQASQSLAPHQASWQALAREWQSGERAGK
ncbi:hypothetical protein [Paludibacterium purpuratum]|uniref:DUF2059 domain-containing protein n=1 Tax=Paludibacterium purpuratum TaxID=1144873 RepID=A0A4R7B6A3_9NEIS|nr:hypothetical protein [Paludibacterium purpuratum]TDR79973.1 hypothetical protein DFP86_106113 [Paludibacterium purpuratum]